MIYGSVCSGVEAATVAWHALGWKPAWFSQYDPEHNYKNGPDFPSKVLAHHYPDVPNLGDMLKIDERPEFNERAINLLVGGTPCQSFSIAGLRKGLDDSRGNLALKFCQILKRKQPRWFIWENVPGVLSSNSGRDFAAILSGFRECGYGFAYRVLDAQYFGVAQRRRRVFVVGHLGDWRPAGAVLFEREGLRGDSAPCRETGERIADCLTVGANQYSGFTGEPVEYISRVSPTLPARTKSGGGMGTDFDCDGGLIAARKVAFGEYVEDGTASTVCAMDYKDATDLVCFQSKASASQSMNPSGIAPTLTAPIQEKTIGANGKRQDGGRSDKIPAVTVAGFKGGQGSGALGFEEEKAPTITAEGSHNAHSVLQGMAVRRLTPKECERLQGFPDNYTLIPINNKGGYAPDGHRYKAMGNSMAVPVMRWIGERIQLFEDSQNGGN